MKLLKLSIIIPCLNEADNILATLEPLQQARKRGHEVILCDGGSTDNTVSLSENLVDTSTHSNPGRYLQMNTGASYASGDVLCFLHADTIAPENIDQLITHALNHSHKIWGRFNVRLSGSFWFFRVIEFLMNTRSCLTGIATGDQGIFISRNIFNKISGFSDLPLMEDIEISKRLRKITFPHCISKKQLITSSRRWEQHGILNTVFLMWKLRLQYFLGTPASSLAKSYQTNDNTK